MKPTIGQLADKEASIEYMRDYGGSYMKCADNILDHDLTGEAATEYQAAWDATWQRLVDYDARIGRLGRPRI